MQVCTSLQTDNHASTSPLCFFTGQRHLLPPNQQCQSTEGSTDTQADRQTDSVLVSRPLRMSMRPCVCLYVSVSLSFYLSFCLSAYSSLCVCVCVYNGRYSRCRSWRTFCQSCLMSVSLSVCMFLCPSVCLSICLPLCVRVVADVLAAGAGELSVNPGT